MSAFSDCKSKHGRTPLLCAFDRDSSYVVIVLLDAGASPHVPGPAGKTLLHRAVVEDCIAIVQVGPASQFARFYLLNAHARRTLRATGRGRFSLVSGRSIDCKI